MRFLRLFLLFTGINILVSSVGEAALPYSRIIVIVNKDAITASDLDERIRLINLSAGRPVTTPIPEDLRKQIIQGMIDEILQLQAARAKKIKIDDADVELSLANLAKDNKMSLGDMLKMLKSNGISKQTMLIRLKAQMAWGRYIREVYGPLVHIHDKEVESFLAKAKDIKLEEPSQDLMDVTLSQAIFDIKPDSPQEVMMLLGPKIEETLQAKGCPAFVNAASGFGAKVEKSRVVKFGQLPDALKTMVKQAKVGKCLDPTMTPDGLVITMVCAKAMPKVTPPPAPTKDTASLALEQEKLGKRSAQELAKLRAAAFIEQKAADQPTKGKQPLLRNAKYTGG
jgi:hypothetical protein